jgi:hypothetical protein
MPKFTGIPGRISAYTQIDFHIEIKQPINLGALLLHSFVIHVVSKHLKKKNS